MIWFTGPTASYANSCELTYDPEYGSLTLWDDAATEGKGGTVGSATTLENTQCSVDLARSMPDLNRSTP